mmetsp:Transcript_46364/g.97000  ORF Transcript_46364/g.97000 Transcript_46364/m.97000 type:complete len:86 (+) Transcript_46364:1023-1280(+)
MQWHKEEAARAAKDASALEFTAAALKKQVCAICPATSAANYVLGSIVCSQQRVQQYQRDQQSHQNQKSPEPWPAEQATGSAAGSG